MASRTTLPQPGELIAGKYRIEHTLGSGGMGVVFQVTHRVTGKRFALKWLLPEASTHDDSAQRFIREAQVAGRFEHPNVVEVYDVGAEGESFYMVIELLAGESLASRVERQGPLSVTETCRLLIPCMRGVAEAHAAGIVHRDLKPANIFVCRATKEMPERAKVLDFGISKMSVLPGEIDSAMTKTGVLMGTPYYMPLEQMRGKDIDHRVDVYAFGVVLYQVLSGKLPYQADSFSDLVLAIANDSPPRLEDVAPGLPATLAGVIRKAMARDQDQRYQSLDALVEALREFAPTASLPPEQAPPPTAAGVATARVSLPSTAASTPPSVGIRPVEPTMVAATESLTIPTPLSTESRPDMLSLPVLLARRRVQLLSAAAGFALVCGLIALATQRDGPKRTDEAAGPVPETSVLPIQAQRAAGAAQAASDAPPRAEEPAAASDEPQESSTLSVEQSSEAGDVSQPSAAKKDARARGNAGRPAEPTVKSAARVPAGRANQGPGKAASHPNGTLGAGSAAKRREQPQAVGKPAANKPEAPREPEPASTEPDPNAQKKKPASKLPTINERDFY